ncbi:MAG: AAA family ATPase [Rhodocyclales bacterium]|nr:AAA family ATPase [Rhodocyclales bacterium]
MMYLEHFGLREAPFRITPHTEFFFAGGNRGATLEALIYAITHDEGIVKVSGEVGSGKTMLCRVLLERLPERVETVYLANPSLSREEILFAIADELGMPLPEGRTHLLQRALQERLLEIYAAGKQVVVLIDEAHAMPAEALEEIRLLSNLESNRHKLLQIVLFGQAELDLRLAQTEMRQLKERITHNFALEPLQRNDIASYLMFRMRAAGYRGPDLFTAGAIQTISRASEGLTRRVNILADKALLAAFAQGSHQVDQREARAAVRDAQFRPMAGDQARARRWLGIGSGGLLAIAGAAFLLSQAATEPRLVPMPPAVAPREMPPAPPATTTGEPAAASPSVPPAPGSTTAPNPNTPPRNAAPPATLGPLTTARLAASEAWLREAPGKRYFIQLMNTDASNAAAVESFLAAYAGNLDSGQLRVYRSALSGRERIGVVYGDFPTPVQASAALAALPASLLDARPYVRSVDKLR